MVAVAIGFSVCRLPLFLLVAAATPGRASAVFISALWNHVEIVIVNIQHVVSTVVAGITVEDFVVLIFVKNTVAFAFRRLRILDLEIVEGLLFCKLLWSKGDVIVEVEARIAGRVPVEGPAHTFLISRQLGIDRKSVV